RRAAVTQQSGEVTPKNEAENQNDDRAAQTKAAKTAEPLAAAVLEALASPTRNPAHLCSVLNVSSNTRATTVPAVAVASSRREREQLSSRALIGWRDPS